MEVKNINNEWCNLNLKNSLLNINVFTVSSVTVTVRVTVTQLQLWAHSPFAGSSHLVARCYVELHVHLPAAGHAVMVGVLDAVLSLKVWRNSYRQCRVCSFSNLLPNRIKS